MADDLRDRLINNLAEVDKSLRRSYIFQIVLCLLFLYLFYNAATVADQTISITRQISDARCVKGEFEVIDDFIKEFGRDRHNQYKEYSQKIRQLSVQLDTNVTHRNTGQYEQTSYYDEQLNPIAANRLAVYSRALDKAIITAKDTVQSIANLTIRDIIDFVRILTLVDPIIKDGVKKFLEQKKDGQKKSPDQNKNNADRLPTIPHLNSKNELQGLQDISTATDFLSYSCLPTSSRGVPESTRAIRFSSRLTALERLQTELENQSAIFKSDIVNHEIKLSNQHQKLQDANIAEINIPFAGQSMNVSFAFRIGPFVILLIQFLICSYFRHRYGLIKKIKSTFESDADGRRVKMDDIHLILWPWILNFPYIKSDKYKAERQQGAAIIGVLLGFFQYLPVITIAIIAFRPIYFGTAGSIETPEITLTDWVFIVTATILLFVTFLQVRYARRLDWQITALLEWKQVAVQELPTISGKPMARWKVKFALLLMVGIFSNFNFHLVENIRLDLAILSSLLTLYAGYRFGRIKGLIFGAVISGLWFILNIIVLVEEYGFDPALLTRPLSLGMVTIPHSSLLALERLALLGYFSGWIFDHIRRGVDQHRLAPNPGNELPNFNKISQLFIGAGTMILIIGTNFDIRMFPQGLPMVALALIAYRRGPLLGVISGVIAIIISTFSSIASEIQFYFQGPGHMIAFGLIGYWSGVIGQFFKNRDNEIQDLGTQLALWETDSAPASRVLPILIVFLAIFTFVYYTLDIENLFGVRLRLVLLPLPTVIVMLMGALWGPRKAAWITAISLGALLAISYTAFALGWHLEYDFSENLFFRVGFFRWSFVSMAIYVVAAYWSGKIKLIDHRRNQYWLAIAIFAAFQLSSILRLGDFLSLSSLFARVGGFRLDIFTSPAQLLEPWLTVIFLNISLQWLIKKKGRHAGA